MYWYLVLYLVPMGKPSRSAFASLAAGTLSDVSPMSEEDKISENTDIVSSLADFLSSRVGFSS